MSAREAFVVVDLGFGDGGKGATVDFLVRDRGADLVVRFHGGGQAGHRVVAPDGRAHVFSQLGAGTFVPGVRTHLAEGFVLHPLALRVELARLASIGLGDVLSRTTIDERALLITPFHQAMGRLEELARGEARHGSVGIGFGDAVRDALEKTDDTLRAEALRSRAHLERALTRVRERKRARARALGSVADFDAARPELGLLEDVDAPSRIADAWASFAADLNIVSPAHLPTLLDTTRAIVFEGAQGLLLDERWGFHPHTTWSDCTTTLADRALATFDGSVERLGVFRAYATRHGAGPFPTEDPSYAAHLVDAANDGGSLQGAFRQGPLDLVLLRYALEVAGHIDGLVVSCLDRLALLPQVEVVARYELDEASELVRRDAHGRIVSLVLGAPDDLAHRERLGALLRRVRPIRERLETKKLLDRVAEELARPVVLSADGETAANRSWLRARSPAA